MRAKRAVLDCLLWRQISDYFDQVFDLDPSERPRWLDELATREPELARALRELLAEHESLRVTGFLEGSALSWIGVEPAAEPSMVGTQVGGYTIERLIGRGGMGSVWLGLRSDGRFEGRCAIKFIESAAARGGLADLFHCEGRLLARLSHPNIARLIDAGTTADGKHFLILEYVDGERIDHYCDLRDLTTRARVRLLLDAISAVAHAHNQLIVHRDLKPSNVLVTRNTCSHRPVKRSDFRRWVLRSMPRHRCKAGCPIRNVPDEPR